TIDKASSSVVVTCPTSVTYDGTAQTPCSANVTGAGGLDHAVTPVTYTGNTNAGTASASATFAGDANHDGDTGSKDFTIDKASSSVVGTCPDTAAYHARAEHAC